MRKKTRRKVYQLVNPIEFAIAGASITDKEILDLLRIRELAAIDAMSKGLAGVAEWRDLTEMLNLAETMAKNGIGPEVMETCEIVQAELHLAALRYERTKKMGLTGSGLQAVRDLYEYHDLQRTSIPRSEYERMIKKTRDYILSNAPCVLHIN